MRVQANIGQNTLQFSGAGVSDSYGLGIDNVKLVKAGSNQNLIVNGGFENPNQHPNQWNIYNNIPAWQGSGIEIGEGNIYNCRWKSQICELDGNSNYMITQYLVFDTKYELRSGGQLPSSSNGPTLPYTL